MGCFTRYKITPLVYVATERRGEKNAQRPGWKPQKRIARRATGRVRTADARSCQAPHVR